MMVTEFDFVRDVLLSQGMWLLIIGGVGWLIKRMLDSRKEKRAANAGQKIATIETLAASIKELRGEVAEQFMKLETQIKLGEAADRVFMHDRLKHVGTRYVAAGAITFDDRRDYIDMYEQYHNLGGNGSIAVLYNSVLNLPSKQ